LTAVEENPKAQSALKQIQIRHQNILPG